MEAFLDEVNRSFKPLFSRVQSVLEAARPIASEIIQQLDELDLSTEVLSRAGWLPHYTTPFGEITVDMGTEAVRNKILEYYAVNWGAVRSEIETRLANYNIDDEAKETLREALYAHEAKLYRCVVRVLFPEVERALRTMLLDDITKRIGYKELVEKLNEGKAIDDFILQGLYDLHLFNHLTRALEEEGESESDDMVFGWFQRV